VNQAESDQLRDLLVELVRHLDQKDRELARRIEALEQRSAHALAWAGPWKSGKRYREGQFTQKDGGLWMCLADTEGATPGRSPHWKLLVKRGAFSNGKDAR